MKICAYCGTPVAGNERDHVVPRCLYPPSGPGPGVQLLTVPVCRPCNSSFQDDEERFRNFIVVGGRTAGVVDGLFWGKVLRSLRGKGKGRRGKLQWLLDQMREEHTPAGTEVRVYPDERVLRVVRKIIRGLAFHHFGQPLPDECVSAEVLQFSVPDNLLDSPEWHDLDADVFRYGYEVGAGPGAPQSLWLMSIYRNRNFFGYVRAACDNKPPQRR